MTNSSRREAGHWVFGYGSLIYKVDFPYLDRAVASIRGWERRFWQGSHDHRGTPNAPGRVLTLVPSSPDQVCLGMAYRVEHEVFAHLDHREKNGYERRRITIRLRDSGDHVNGLVYFAGHDNPAWLGPAGIADIAHHIDRSQGPSGSNRDYLLDLAQALRELGAEDPHVFELERAMSRAAHAAEPARHQNHSSRMARQVSSMTSSRAISASTRGSSQRKK